MNFFPVLNKVLVYIRGNGNTCNQSVLLWETDDFLINHMNKQQLLSPGSKQSQSSLIWKNDKNVFKWNQLQALVSWHFCLMFPKLFFCATQFVSSLHSLFYFIFGNLKRPILKLAFLLFYLLNIGLTLWKCYSNTLHPHIAAAQWIGKLPLNINRRANRPTVEQSWQNKHWSKMKFLEGKDGVCVQ